MFRIAKQKQKQTKPKPNKRRKTWISDEPVFWFLAGIKGHNWKRRMYKRNLIQLCMVMWHTHCSISVGASRWGSWNMFSFFFLDLEMVSPLRIKFYPLEECMCAWVCVYYSLDNWMKIWQRPSHIWETTWRDGIPHVYTHRGFCRGSRSLLPSLPTICVLWKGAPKVTTIDYHLLAFWCPEQYVQKYNN